MTMTPTDNSQSPLQSILQAALLHAISAPGCKTLREKVNTLWMLGMRNQADIARVVSLDPKSWKGVSRQRVSQILGDKMREYKSALSKLGTHRDADDAGKPLDVTIHLRLSSKQLQNYKTSAESQSWPSLNEWLRELSDASSKIQALGVNPLEVLWEAIGRIADERTVGAAGKTEERRKLGEQQRAAAAGVRVRIVPRTQEDEKFEDWPDDAMPMG